ncbi:unnamed protein product [marine sediment metagenome]|uniref:Peptidase C-terminal archaeal/bacterial domain-containing protein n=1 Tax=marine sediment metagenome TaxID=412755 RepID=X1K946_9ZZZZ
MDFLSAPEFTGRVSELNKWNELIKNESKNSMIIHVTTTTSLSTTTTTILSEENGLICEDCFTNSAEFFYFNILTPAKITIIMTPSPDVNYDLYTRWNSDKCPTTLNWDCRPVQNVGIPETCSFSDLPIGRYCLMVNKQSGIGTFNISVF